MRKFREKLRTFCEKTNAKIFGKTRCKNFAKKYIREIVSYKTSNAELSEQIIFLEIVSATKLMVFADFFTARFRIF